MSTVSATDSTTTSPYISTTSDDSSSLDVDDFLELLTVQLSNQDPFDPMDDTDFIAQMANFTSLEEMSNMSENFVTFTSRLEPMVSQMYLGKQVTMDDDGDTISGEVTDVNIDTSGNIFLTVDGNSYDIAGITSVSPESTDE